MKTKRGDCCGNRQARRVPIWAYVVVNVLALLLRTRIAGKDHPGLIKERLRPGPGARDGFWCTMALFLPPWIGHYILAALDRGRWHWSDSVPFRAQVVGLAGYTATFGLISWAVAANPFFSSVARIQRERGHYLVTAGPYRYVRHPGYVGGIALLLFSGLSLNSWLSLLPGVGWIPLIIRRTIIEDKLLEE
ncbi:MAG: hypothetical protein HY675_04865 [Chloroflexi bacterium]|nr:hypothetical protein [Chloroflexota bacterium]